jgi:PAS domain S-box-containing protein
MLNILLVEDDVVDVMNVRRAFKKNNICNPLWVAGNGAEGLEMLRGPEIPRDRRLILLDLNMPRMNGIEFLRQLRADPEHRLTPVVVLTTSDDERDRVDAYNLNVSGYILKPVTLMNFVEAMATLNKYWTAEGAMVTESETWRDLTGQTHEQMRGSGWLNAIHPDDRESTRSAWATATREGSMYEMEHRVRGADGKYRFMVARGVPVRDEAGNIVEWVGAHTDISRRKQAEIERELAMASRNRFYAAMSHEIRTPMNAILGYTDLLLAGAYGEMNEEQTRGIERTYRAGQHLLELVNDVLDLSKLEAGKLQIDVEPTSIPELVEDLFATVRPLATASGPELVLEHDGCSTPIDIDPRRVRQILFNLLSNAIKFGGPQPVAVRCSRGEDGGVTMEVRDQGPGIEEADIPRIFEEFVQLSGTDGLGTGLGLPISKRLAELMGGRLEVDSSADGSIFLLVLPAAVPQRQLAETSGDS